MAENTCHTTHPHHDLRHRDHTFRIRRHPPHHLLRSIERPVWALLHWKTGGQIPPDAHALCEESLSLTQAFLDEKISADEALDNWPSSNAKYPRQLSQLYHAINHYRDDRDIREKEPEYEARQKEDINSKYREIRSKIHLGSAP